MLTLQFELEYQKINLVNRWETVATDSKNYLVASFSTISDDWTTPITAIFTNDKDEQPYAVVVGADSTLESNECYVPWEVLKDESNVYVSAYCGNLHTTVTAQFHVYKSGYADGEIPPPPSPTVYDAIMEAITALQNGKQDKLTAGENITIDEDNVISAEGGVTSYDDLTDKPVLRIQTGSTTENITIEDVIKLTPFYKIFGTDIITLDTSRLYNKIIDGIHSYTDFDSISNTTRGGVVLCSINAEGIPSFINARNRKFVLYNFEGLHDDGCAQLIFWIDNTSGESKSAFRVGTGGLWQASDWVELTGSGSQIVSGVVNSNGTITFTDSDGGTFTTTGSSVIGADGIGIADVHIDGGGDLIIEYTTGHMENVGHVVGADGQDYVLTAQDKSDIADIVLSELPTTQGVQYGN